MRFAHKNLKDQISKRTTIQEKLKFHSRSHKNHRQSAGKTLKKSRSPQCKE